ncbi:hypothetical protein, partial [Haemophilus influenzae]|uniref:hypothetical protein n=1 Tax=Haemophilus influenzae TaxID=727 RepID=UPI00195485C7
VRADRSDQVLHQNASYELTELRKRDVELVETHQCRKHVCGGIGYNGQTIISECEYFPYPESLDPFIKRVRDGEDHRQTWPLMIEDALLKMDQKITDRAEIERVFSSEFADHLERIRASEPQAPPIA